MAKKSGASVYSKYSDFLITGEDLRTDYWFHSGLIGLDKMLSADGGIPGGSIVQLLGEPGCGKTTVSYDFIAQAQKRGLRDVDVGGKNYNVVICDFERSFDAVYARKIGVDTSKTLVIRSDYAEQSFTVAERLLLDGIQVLLVDSIGMLVASDESDKTYEDSPKMAVEASVLSRFTKRVNAFLKPDALALVINQYRGDLSQSRATRKAYGARVAQYVMKIGMEFRASKQDTCKHVTVDMVRNKVGGAENQSLEFDILYNSGIDYAGHILDLAERHGVIMVGAGGRYAYKDFRAHGKEKARNTLPIDEIEKEVRTKLTKVV
jgi:recombination protein RecA